MWLASVFDAHLQEVKKAEGEAPAASSDDKAAPVEVQAKINPFDSKEVANMRNHVSIDPIAQLLV